MLTPDVRQPRAGAPEVMKAFNALAMAAGAPKRAPRIDSRGSKSPVSPPDCCAIASRGKLKKKITFTHALSWDDAYTLNHSLGEWLDRLRGLGERRTGDENARSTGAAGERSPGFNRAPNPSGVPAPLMEIERLPAQLGAADRRSSG